VRVMSYVRLRGKTGIWEYRRVIPPRLRPVIPSLEGFDSRPGRTEFTKSLDTRAKAEANRRAAIIDQQVQVSRITLFDGSPITEFDGLPTSASRVL